MPGNKVYRCNCARHCKIPTGKSVCKSTYYAHANFRKSLSPMPGGFRNVPPGEAPQAGQVFGQAPSLAEILGGYPGLNLAGQVEVRVDTM